MESRRLSDADLLNILENDLQTTVANTSYENQSNESDHANQSVITTNENGENINQSHNINEKFEVDKSKADIRMEKLEMSETADDFNENAMAHISLNVNEAELDILNDSSTEDEEELNNETEKMDDDVASNIKESSKKPMSPLHCAICSNYFDCPKLLDCFHTFCKPCLMKQVKSNHKFIFCQICRYRTNIPKGGVAKLMDNVVAAGLIAAKSEKQQLSECMICKLHNEVKASAGQCIDCGDTMCEDCCEKHTFSRLTANHKVVPLAELKSEDYLKLQQKTKVIKCKQHSYEAAEFLCSDCCVPVCRDCTMSGHRLHKCQFLNEAIAGKKEHIQKELEALKQECALKLVDDTEESEILISEHEQKEFKKLKDTKDAMISIIEQKYDKCAEKLQQEFDIKRRKYCKHKATFIRAMHKDVGILAENVDFMLKEGGEVENTILETFIISALEQKKVKLTKLRPKLTRHNNFPKAHVYREHIKVLEGLTFFSTDLLVRDQNLKDQAEKIARSAMHVENAEVRMKIGRNFQMEFNDAPSPTQAQSVMPTMMSDVRTQMAANFQTGMNFVPQSRTDMQPPSILSMNLSNLRAPVGRGRGTSYQSGSDTKSSLLGEYTGQNMFALQDALSDKSSQCSDRSRNRRYRPKLKEQTGMPRGQRFRLNLSTSLNVKVIMDQKIPDIVDLVFMSHQNFAVADARNHRLKLFSFCGKFIKYIDDPGPMSVTFCANHLIWSSQFSSIKVLMLT
ncbi:uncharacterized protein LOC128555486 isoform X2 [Mercenaria mercenaria]|uniref:uncharacterized protein LOC128555486 isoform X2 n=1 Tax=Mercenaria mercenaria TaxID=6596 RepID=UPI00234EFA0D|nr:uncharacterized protein LOC128555486 isoform X2 [Mercenaria mercenaria]